jgi:putative ABC transport system permease protein
MIKWIKIAFRNLLKNRRRSIVTLIAISVGFASVSLFRGYADSTFQGLREAAIRGEGIGHLTIYKEGWLEKGSIDPQNHMFLREEVQRIINLVEDEDDVILATPKIDIEGLVSNGKISTIFIATGLVPRDDITIKGAMASLRPINGEALNDKKTYGIEIAEGLAARLGLKPGMDAVVMASTIDGHMNALDIQVMGIYDTGSPATNDKLLRVQFKFAQSLYDTDMADRIVVLLADWKKTELIRAKLNEILSHEGLNCEIKTWQELSQFFNKVKGMYNMIFLFIFFIVLIIVVMSIVNTMGMSVLERTREIGTLRALGLKRRGVALLFAIEGAMIGFIGSIFGILLNIIIWAIIRGVKPTYIPPGVSSPVPLVVNLIPSFLFMLIVFIVALSLLAAILPARYAAKKNVVDALGHV